MSKILKLKELNKKITELLFNLETIIFINKIDIKEQPITRLNKSKERIL